MRTAFLVLLLSVADGVAAQPLQTGAWTGEIVNPNGQTFDVVYEVSMRGGSLTLEIVIPDISRFTTTDFEVTDDTVKFSWHPGNPVSCTLTLLENGSYSGACADPQGTSGLVTMVPPADGDRTAPPPTPPLIPGEVQWGAGRYVEFRVGNLPIILSSPHGGELEPRALRDRTRGYTIGDSDTQELTRAIAEALENITGRSPHVVISRLARTKLDPNREPGLAANGDPGAERAWREYHGFIEAAKREVASTWGSGLYLDIHGHGHRTPWVELGYALDGDQLDGSDQELDEMRHSMWSLAEEASVSTSTLVRGPKSIGALLQRRGYRSVPSPGDPGPGPLDYFSTGYSTLRHGSYNGGPISSVLVEHPRKVRDRAGDRRTYARHFAEAIVEFMETFYGFSLDR